MQFKYVFLKLSFFTKIKQNKCTNKSALLVRCRIWKDQITGQTYVRKSSTAIQLLGRIYAKLKPPCVELAVGGFSSTLSAFGHPRESDDIHVFLFIARSWHKRMIHMPPPGKMFCVPANIFCLLWMQGCVGGGVLAAVVVYFSFLFSCMEWFLPPCIGVSIFFRLTPWELDLIFPY